MNDGGDWKDLIKGIQQNDILLVKYHLKNGTDINYQHPEYMTSPLIEAIKYGNKEMIITLLEHGASAEIKEMFTNKSPLKVAIEYKNKEIIALIRSKSQKKLWLHQLVNSFIG
ncbi:MAG TPA: ankyrin repeat domain-containing protein [Saprospiraceae bacterium]|nr:ankyrin repeat domain-containing protein [Saprospiraceae bacterium]